MWRDEPYRRTVRRPQRHALIRDGQPQRTCLVRREAAAVSGHAHDFDAGSSDDLFTREQLRKADGCPLRVGVPAAGAVEPGRDSRGARREIGNGQLLSGDKDAVIGCNCRGLIEKPHRCRNGVRAQVMGSGCDSARRCRSGQATYSLEHAVRSGDAHGQRSSAQQRAA